jgi:hypothetical protein
MSKTKSSRGHMDSLLEKLAKECHISKRRCRTDMLPYFCKIFRTDRTFAIKQIHKLKLAAEEVAILLDEKPEDIISMIREAEALS